MTPFEALNVAFDKVKTQTKFAEICGVGQPTVWKWLRQTKRLPAEYVLKVEAATGVSRHDLRPDIYPRPIPRNTPTGSDFGQYSYEVA